MSGMTLIVKTITRLIIGFIFVFAISVILQGHLTPGGGFAGGVILACAFILLILAFGKQTVFDIVSETSLTVWDSLGATGFLLIAFIGFTSGIFFNNFINRGTPLRLLSGGTIMWSNIFIGIKVASALLAVFFAMVLFRTHSGVNERKNN